MTWTVRVHDVPESSRGREVGSGRIRRKRLHGALSHAHTRIHALKNYVDGETVGMYVP